MRKDAMWGVMGALLVGTIGCGRSGQTVGADDTTATAAPKTIAVNVLIQCAASDSTFIKVTPWAARLDKKNKDDIEWVVDSNSTLDSVFVELKAQGADWPLESLPPYRLGKGVNRKEKQKETAAKTDYQYNIRAYCTEGGRTRRLLIDPDIFVD